MPLSGKRMHVVKWSMYLLSFCQILGKSLEMAVLAQVGGKRLAVGVLVGETTLFLLYKRLRNDFRYYLPLPDSTSTLASIIIRVATKVIHDFTGFLHVRHPHELGGFYWLLNMAMTQGSVFVSVWLKDKFGENLEIQGEGEGEGEAETFIKDEHYIKIAIGLMSLWLVAIMGLLLGSEKEFRSTFYSLQTGKGYMKALFDSGENELMVTIFECHPYFYRNFEEEVKGWLADFWALSPAWLTDHIIDQIPQRLIPGGGEDGFLAELDERSRKQFTIVRDRGGTLKRRGSIIKEMAMDALKDMKQKE